MNTLLPIPYSVYEPIPAGDATEREMMPMEASQLLTQSLYTAETCHACEQLDGLCWKTGVEGMDDQGRLCDAGRACK